jgi:dihydroorotase
MPSKSGRSAVRIPSTVDLVIRGGQVYVSGEFVKADVAIDEGRVVVLGASSRMPRADREIDASGKHVLPGLIDTHAHFRDPGLTHKEDYATGTMAAAAGGVTLAVDMPNVKPPPNTLETFLAHRENASRKAYIDFSHNAAGTVKGEITKIAKVGQPMAFKIFMISDVGRDYPHMPGIGVANHGELLERFEEIQKTGLPVMVHPWDQDIWAKLSKEREAEGKTDFREYAKAERAYDSILYDNAISVLINLQRVTGVRLHVLHMSSKRSFENIQAARAQGQLITTEVNPAAVFLANSWKTIEKLGPYSLGTWIPEHEGEYTWKMLSDGIADVVATDHAPHTKEEKEPGWKNMWKAAGGRPIIEWFLPLFLSEVNRDRITLERVVQLCSENPARIFSVYPRKGALLPGSDADLVIVDMKKEKTLSGDRMYTKCAWNPFAGRRVRGHQQTTIVRGTVVMEDYGNVIGKQGYGKYVSPTIK